MLHRLYLHLLHCSETIETMRYTQKINNKIMWQFYRSYCIEKYYYYKRCHRTTRHICCYAGFISATGKKSFSGVLGVHKILYTLLEAFFQAKGRPYKMRSYPANRRLGWRIKAHLYSYSSLVSQPFGVSRKLRTHSKRLNFTGIIFVKME